MPHSCNKLCSIAQISEVNLYWTLNGEDRPASLPWLWHAVPVCDDVPPWLPRTFSPYLDRCTPLSEELQAQLLQGFQFQRASMPVQSKNVGDHCIASITMCLTLHQQTINVCESSCVKECLGTCWCFGSRNLCSGGRRNFCSYENTDQTCRP